MAIDLRVVCDELQRLGKGNPNQEARDQLNAALTSKWEGVRLVAARALAQWGDEESFMAIRVLLEDLSTESHRSSATSQVVSLLMNHLKRVDFEWVVDLFNHKAHPDNRQRLEGLFRDFPPSMVRTRMEIEQENAKGDERLTRAICIVIMRSKH